MLRVELQRDGRSDHQKQGDREGSGERLRRTRREIVRGWQLAGCPKPKSKPEKLEEKLTGDSKKGC
jgi:hypothetical protein